jgi:type IV pilus assembly protein PilM
MSSPVVTIYIDDSSIRLMAASGKRVRVFAELPLESGLVKDGVIMDPAAVAAKVKDIVKAKNIHITKVVAGVSGLHSLCRVITLPTVPRALLSEAVKREAERVMAVPLEQFYISWQALRSTKEEIQIFLAAIPCNIIDTLIIALQQADLKPEIIDLAPLALARVVNRMSAIKMTTAMVVNIRAKEIDIVLLVDGVPQLVRSLYIPGELASMPERLASVREELERTIKYYRSTCKEASSSGPLPIFVAGGIDQTQTTKICEVLGGNAQGNPFLPLLSPLKWPQDAVQRQYMINVGLALKRLASGAGPGQSKVNLNALPEAYRPKPPSMKRAFAVAGIGAMVLFIAVLALIVQTRTANTEALSAQLETSNQFLKRSQAIQQSQNKQVTQLEQQIIQLEQSRDMWVRVLETFTSEQEVLNGDLNTVVSGLADGVVLSNIRHSGSDVAVMGTAPNEELTLAYATMLENSGRYSEIILSRIERDDGTIAFTIMMRCKRGAS